MKHKPMLARDWKEGKVKFPCYIQPKIDGVRALNQDGTLIGRSLKQHANKFVTSAFSLKEFIGFDGEMITGADPTISNLCRITSGDMRREDGIKLFTWYLFDYITEDTINLPYSKRMDMLQEYVFSLPENLQVMLEIVPSVFIRSIEELEIIDNKFLDEGYEGSIIRSPKELHKEGRSDGKMQCWRIKRFIDAEFLIEEIIEGKHNANESKKNELGRTERSTMQDNMIPNGTVGALKGTLLADVLDPQTDKVILNKGDKITVSAGTMSHDDRKYYFENPDEILQQIGKLKLFPKGTKDKPRFPTFSSIRSKEDMS